jgi:hypothetical protein
MMHVDLQPEPGVFHDRVRRPGHEFLKTNPKPTSRQLEKRPYWKRVKSELHSAYKGICSFSCHWIPHDTGSITVEHFYPKSNYQHLAYEWSNFRLMCGTLNGRKGNYEDVLDPFAIHNGMFVLQFTSLIVRPFEGLDGATAKSVRATIDRLQLNDEGTCLQSRFHYVDQYCNGQVNFSHLDEEAPFIAYELRRQKLVRKIKKMWLTPA